MRSVRKAPSPPVPDHPGIEKISFEQERKALRIQAKQAIGSLINNVWLQLVRRACGMGGLCGGGRGLAVEIASFENSRWAALSFYVRSLVLG